MRLLLLLLSLCSVLAAANSDRSKVLICGVCRNISQAVDNSILNIENLGERFSDYAVLIYENNSHDDTASKLKNWAARNPKVCLISKTLNPKKLNLPRTVRIAHARNKVLKEARKKKYERYNYLVMVDLDFLTPWPNDEVVNSINLAFDWDCISANGCSQNGTYYDRFAYRSYEHPFGPELLENEFWKKVDSTPFSLQQSSWPLVYSAFGGLAIYKRDVITKFSYSGTVTGSLRRYYETIMRTLPPSHPYLAAYKALNPKKDGIVFRQNCLNWQMADDKSKTVCEHVTLHAAMALKGYKTFYINPKLIMAY